MKIVHIITRLIVGGAQENTLLSCEGQHAAGHDVTLLTGPALGPEGTLMPRAQSAGYKVQIVDAMRRSVLPLSDFRVYGELKRILREARPDVVHTHSSKAGIVGRWAAHAESCPRVVHTIHGLAFTSSRRALVNGFYKTLERRAAPITHKIISVADAMTRASLDAGIGRPDQYVTVHSGMEIEPFLHPPVPRNQVRRQLGLTDDAVAVGTIARLFHMKGHDDLLDLAPALCGKFPQLRFVFIGDGILRSQFVDRIAAMNLTDRFIFTGLVSPTMIPQLVAALDIVAHPSRREGLARAIPQGQLARCPVVCYDIDGNAEGLLPGESGFAVRPFDVAAFGEALGKLLDSRLLRIQMADRGRAFAREIFDAGRMVARLNEVYESITPRPLRKAARS